MARDLPSSPTHDIIERVRTQYDELTPKQRRVAEFVLDHADEASYLNSIQIADRLGVAKATVVRFAQRLGFDGYGDLKDALAMRSRSRLTMVDRLVRLRGSVDTMEAVIASVIEHDIEHLRQLQTEITPQVVEEIVSVIARSRRVFVVGLRNSAPLAYFTWFGLRQIRDDVVLLSWSCDDWPEQVRNTGPEDAVIAFSFRRYARRTLEIVGYLHARGTRVIAFSDKRSSPLARFEAILVPCGYRGPSFFGSPVAAMSAAGIVLAATAHKHQQATELALESVESVLKDASILVDAGPRTCCT